MAKVANFIQPVREGIDRAKGTPRDRTTNRAARRNIAKIAYRKAKRAS